MKSTDERKILDYSEIIEFNHIYGLGAPSTPTLPSLQDYCNFLTIFQDEVDEGRDILSEYKDKPEIDTLTDISDWLGDMLVYICTCSARWGIPLERIIPIITESNRSKLSSTGEPIINETTGKVEKGPNYWKPEPRIKEILLKLQKESSEDDKS